MRVLITGDTQTEYHNIPQCKKMWKHVLQLCEQYSLEAIVLAGDIKAQYNPVDIRVIKFWMWAIRYAKRKSKVRVLVVLGNHDRVGLYSDSDNWLEILRRAGAEVFDKPSVVAMQTGHLSILPFATSTNVLRNSARRLSKSRTWDDKRDVLIFHADVKGCAYNQLGQKSEARLKPKELYPKKYLACVGAHVHLPQKIQKNIYYVGSPFAMDWGEANQRKRFLLVLDGEIKSVDSKIPGMFDPSWPGFYRPKSWEGTKVRVHVECKKSDSYQRKLEKARLHAERHFVGAEIFCVPEFVDEKKSIDTKVLVDGSDEKKIEAYVKETCPDALWKSKEKVLHFLIQKLKEVHGLSRSTNEKTKFKKFVGRNVLSYKKLELDFDKLRGLVLIEGENRDWNSQSNGSGKTNLVQSIPISIHGTTFKKQKAAKWARRQTKEKAYADLRLKTSKGDIKIYRQRRPTKLQLFVNGQDQSSGHRTGSRNSDHTQGMIESITGFTWQTLANSVYLDRETTLSFLIGTPGERKNLLSKFQNLERFERAQVLVKKAVAKHEKAVQQNEVAIAILKTKIEERKQAIKQREQEAKSRIKDVKSKFKEALSEWKTIHSSRQKLEKKWRRLKRKLEPMMESIDKQIAKLQKKIDELRAEEHGHRKHIQRSSDICRNSVCPTCGHRINRDHHRAIVDSSKKALSKLTPKIEELEKAKRRLDDEGMSYEADIDATRMRWMEAKDKTNLAAQKVHYFKQLKRKEENQEHHSHKKEGDHLKRLVKDLREYKEYVESMQDYKVFLDYCLNAFSKHGIPAYLNAQLCTPLNRAAEYYADLFCDKQIQVRFELDDGDITPKVINSSGGENLNDQSAGESAMLGLITGFALKEIAPKSNLLVLDEPTDGLSGQNTKRFGSSLRKLKDRFDTIMVVTHSPVLLGELSSERVIKVVKEKGVSKIKGEN